MSNYIVLVSDNEQYDYDIIKDNLGRPKIFNHRNKVIDFIRDNMPNYKYLCFKADMEQYQ